MSIISSTVAKAKARLRELLEEVRSKGPQIITRLGRKTAIVVSAEESERETRRTGNSGQFFAASPLGGSGIDIERTKDLARWVDR